MTSSTQDTTPRSRSIGPAAHQPARGARRNDERHGTRAAHGAPRWNPDDGDYS